MGLLPGYKLTDINNKDEGNILFGLPHQLQHSLCKKAAGKRIKGVEHVPVLPSPSGTQLAQALFSARLPCVSATSYFSFLPALKHVHQHLAFRQVRCQTGVLFTDLPLT